MQPAACRSSSLHPTLSRWLWLFMLLAGTRLQGQQAAPAGVTAGPAVRGVLFYSPTCPHCRDLLTIGLPPILDRFGSRLRIVAVSVASSDGVALYRAVVEHYAVPHERLGVPMLVVGSRVLVGSAEIPAALPDIVERGLAEGGIPLPDVPGLREALAPVTAQEDSAAAARAAAAAAAAQASAATASPPTTVSPAALPSEQPHAAVDRKRTGAGAGARSGPAAAGRAVPLPAATAATVKAARADRRSGQTPIELRDGSSARQVGASEETATPLRQRFTRDLSGNVAAVSVLLLMLVALGVVAAARRSARVQMPVAPHWVVPALAVVGLGIAAYLTFIEVTGLHAVCGPVGDCNTVQQSPYARLFGILPVGALGMLGYLLFIATWGVAVLGPAPLQDTGRRALWWSALLGTFFSLYLTFLEPFVIGASCAWCLSSAVLVTLVLLAATSTAGRADVAPRHRQWQVTPRQDGGA